MISRTEIIQTVKSIAYKPGWKFDVRFSGFRGALDLNQNELEFRIVAKCINAFNHKEIIDINTMEIVHIERFRDSRDVLDFIKRMVEGLELHEVKEFFQVDGKQIYEPHPELKKLTG